MGWKKTLLVAYDTGTLDVYNLKGLILKPFAFCKIIFSATWYNIFYT